MLLSIRHHGARSTMSELRQYLDFIRPWDDDDHKVITTQWTGTKPDGTTEKRMMMRAAVHQADVEAIILYYDGKRENTWFSTQSFSKSDRVIGVGNNSRWLKQVNRKQQYVTALHNFYADLDVKPGAYAS